MRLNATTRRSARVAVALAGALLLTLSACSSSSSPAKQADSATAPSGTALFPAVSGGYGTKPTLTFPDAKPSAKLQVKVLSAGTGPVVAKGQLLIADYLGQIWRGKVFDNSYDRKQPLPTAIGVGQVIRGWDTGLVGKRVGSRVLLVVPPGEGYGSAGQSSAGIKGTDTLAFVIDLVSTYSKTDIGDKSAAAQAVSTAPVTVTGALGAEPKITVAKGAKLPTAAKVTVLAKAKGAPVKAGVVVLQLEAVYYDGTLADSTYQRGQPLGLPVGRASSTSPLDGLVGVPIGSRVLVTSPYTPDAKTKTALAIVVDIVAETAPATPKK